MPKIFPEYVTNPETDPVHVDIVNAISDPAYVEVTNPTTNPVNTQDSGLNTNPRRYEKDNGFASGSAVVLAGPAAVQIWAAGLGAAYPVAGRTAGQVTTIYTFEIENSTGGIVTAWLENAAGQPLTVPYHVGNNNTVVIDYIAGKNMGDIDVYLNASVAGVVAHII